MSIVDRSLARSLFEEERANFISKMQTSQKLSKEAAKHLLFSVPLHWMNDWPTPFSLYVEHANGAKIYDVDNHEYIDFCLGDTGAMFGHSPEPVVKILKDKLSPHIA